MKINWSFIEPVRDQAARLRGDFTAKSEIVKLAEQQAEIERLREENAGLREQNTELMLRAHALLWLLPPETTCGELRKARDEMLAATIREGGDD